METYFFDGKSTPLTFRRRVALALGAAVVYAGIMLTINLVWRTGSNRTSSFGDLVIGALFQGALWGALMAFLPLSWTKPIVYRSKLQVDDDSITVISEHTSGIFKGRTFHRTVRKGRIQSIFEIKGPKGVLRGVGISEHTQFGARMRGFVFFSTSMPEFESLRQLAESWKANAKIN